MHRGLTYITAFSQMKMQASQRYCDIETRPLLIFPNQQKNKNVWLVLSALKCMYSFEACRVTTRNNKTHVIIRKFQGRMNVKYMTISKNIYKCTMQSSRFFMDHAIFNYLES